MAEQYRIPKQRVPAKVAFRGGHEEEMSFFVGEHAANRIGSERLSDLIQSTNAFIVAENGRSQIEIIQTGSIETVIVESRFEEYEGGDGISELPGHEKTQVSLTVILENGVSIDCEAHYYMPESRQRLQDFLNDADPFVRLNRKDNVILINKDRISRVIEHPPAEAETRS